MRASHLFLRLRAAYFKTLFSEAFCSVPFLSLKAAVSVPFCFVPFCCRGLLSKPALQRTSLEGQLQIGEQLLHAFDQLAYRMLLRGVPEVLCGEMNIDLRAGDLFVAQEVSERDQADAFLDQVGCESVAQPMR